MEEADASAWRDQHAYRLVEPFVVAPQPVRGGIDVTALLVVATPGSAERDSVASDSFWGTSRAG
jgi:hypothetical protein